MKMKLLTNRGENLECEDVFCKAVEFLKKGKIIAVKGLGGFHLACDAENGYAVECLRYRKKRPHKPLAIMAKNLNLIKSISYVSNAEEKAIINKKAPIVLLRKNANYNLPKCVAPDMKRVGIMLPYTDIHRNLFDEGLNFLVMTSGNISSAPIQYKDLEALNALSDIADYFILHDNPIGIPLEDSVVKFYEEREIIVRGGRGYTPSKRNIDIEKAIVALGGEQKSTFAISKDGYAYLSQFFGDLKYIGAFEAYENELKKYMNQCKLKPDIIAFDLHPSFITSQYAAKMEGIKMPIQHHHAHMVSCMVEHSIYDNVLGVIYDGTGLGTDDQVWGGEFFIGSRDRFIRAGHFKYAYIQGGDLSIKEPWRIAISYLYSLGYEAEKYIKDLDFSEADIVIQALKNNLNCYKSSSVGRLFDCVSSLLGLCNYITYDAEGAILLENIIDEDEGGSYAYRIQNNNGCFQIDYREILDDLLSDIMDGADKSIISARFHNTLVKITVDMVIIISKLYGLNTVVLSGGCFENTYLLGNILERLRGEGFITYYNQQIPTNDSGISIGQLAIANRLGWGRLGQCRGGSIEW